MKNRKIKMRIKITFMDETWYDGDAINGIPNGTGTYGDVIYEYSGVWINGISIPNMGDAASVDALISRQNSIIDHINSRQVLNTNMKQRMSGYFNHMYFSGTYDNGILGGFVFRIGFGGKDEGQYLHGREKNTPDSPVSYSEYEMNCRHGVKIVVNNFMTFFNNNTQIGYEKTLVNSERILRLDDTIFVNRKIDIGRHVGYVYKQGSPKDGRIILTEGTIVFRINEEIHYDVNGDIQDIISI